MYNSAIDILSVMCPYKVTLVRKTPTPWITPDILNMIHEKRALIKRYKNSGDQGISQEKKKNM